MAYSLSKQQKVKEIVKSGKNPDYFLNNYARISHPQQGTIPFRTYDFQADLLENFNDYRFTVVLKARQLGISTIVAGYVTWMMMFHRDKNILVVATKFTTAANLVKKVKQIIKRLPEWMQIADITTDNRTSFELSNGSQIKASTTSGDAGRSEALSLLVIDEAAHVEGLDELWTGLYPTLSTGGRCISLSTPNGVGNWFHKIYTEADLGENDFYPIRLPWDVHPDRDKTWYQKETRNMSRREIAQELECNFNTSGETVIHPDDIAWIETTKADPEYRTGFDRNFWIWEKYDPSCTYLLAADVARGDGADNSTFHIFNLTTSEFVAEYQGKPSLDMYASILDQAGREYGNCMMVVENVGIGISVLEKLIGLDYPNLYFSTKGTHEYVEQYQAESMTNAIPGFTTSSKTRPLIVAKLEEFVRNKLIKIKSPRLYKELTTFIWYNGKPQAMGGYNDDLVIAAAIACWIKDTVLQVNKREVEYNKALLGSMIVANTKLNTRIDGMEGYKKSESAFETEDERTNAAKYSWLYKG